MKRIINTLICSTLLLLALSCRQEALIVDMPVNESIILDLSSGFTKAADTDAESYVDHVDVFIFAASGSVPGQCLVHENFTINDASSVTLAAKRTDFTENAVYFVYLIANSIQDLSDIASYNDLRDRMQEDLNLHLTGLTIENAPKYFLMDGIAKDNGGNSPVVLYNGKPEDNTELHATLTRAAAKVVINITAGDAVTFMPYDINDGSEGGLYYVRNMPYDTYLLAETLPAEDILHAKLTTTGKAVSGHFSWNPNTAEGQKKVSLTTYVYPHCWVGQSIIDKETCVIMNLPLDYKKDAASEPEPFHESWYKIPMTNNQTFERNNYYEINITLNRPGAIIESEPVVLEEVFYAVDQWTSVDVNISEAVRPSFIQLNTDHVDMYNVNTDNSTLKFSSSSEISRIDLVSATYVNKFGETVNVTEAISATAASGLNGGITIFSPFVKEEGVVASDSHNNVVRNMEFRVYNNDGLSATFTVSQYPTIYIDHELGHYSYRDDFGGTTYLAAGDPNRSGANWSSGSWSYTQTASSSNFFASKVANTYTLNQSGVATMNDPSGSNGNYSISYVYWGQQSSGGMWPGGGRPGSGSGSSDTGEVTRQTSNVGSGFNNPRMYHVHVTATSSDYIVAKPRLDANGFTESTKENTMLVSPSFMIASQLGTTDMGGGSSTVSIDKARQHCEKYVEVTYDAAGNMVAYDDWRLPTAAEIDIILDHQYDSQAMVEVLSGGNYYCAYNPDGSGNTQYLKKNTYNSLTSNHVRCIRDVY